MPTLEYKLEYIKDDDTAGDDGAMLHVRTDVPSYRTMISKEEYGCLPEDKQNDFITSLFAIPGVVWFHRWRTGFTFKNRRLSDGTR
jgi:hypothetical protein